MTSPDLKAQSKASPLFSSPATLLLSKDQTANVDLALFPSEIRWDSFQGKPASNFQAKLTISGCLPFSLCASSRTLPSHASLSSIFGVSFSTRPALSRRSKRWNRLLKTFLKDPTTYVTVHAFRKDNDRARPVYLPTTFEFATLEVASAWVEKASNLVHFGRVDGLFFPCLPLLASLKHWLIHSLTRRLFQITPKGGKSWSLSIHFQEQKNLR